MEKALHPDKLNKITVAQYIMDFGNNKPAEHERAVCPVCRQRMKIVAPPDKPGHFSHLGGGYCPTKEKAGARYKDLHPTHPDAEAAKRMKSVFRENWKIHFSQLNKFVIGLSKKEFFEVLQLADAARIWEYAHLKEFYLPYIFATLRDFPPETSLKIKGEHVRKCYFRCFFDSSVRRYDDLWIRESKDVQFFRAWYEVPHGKKKPNIENLLDYYGQEVNDHYLKKEPKVPIFYVDEIHEWVERRYPLYKSSEEQLTFHSNL